MKRVRWSHFFASLAIGLWMVLLAGSSFAAEEAKAPEPAKVEAPAAAPLHRRRQRRRRSCRRYFTATSDDPKKPPPWPDPTGAASGVWATPAGDGKGDIPEKLSTQDVYDRMVHNLYSINYRVGARRWILWSCSCRQDSCWSKPVFAARRMLAHGGYESDDLSARRIGFLALWFCDWLGQLVEWSGCTGLVSLTRSRFVDAEWRLGIGCSSGRCW